MIASCEVDLPAVDNGQSERSGCRVNWDMSANVAGSAVVDNPD